MLKTFTAVAAATAFLLSGCGNTDSSVEDKPVSVDDTFISVVHDNSDYFDDASDSAVIELGHTICDAFDRGVDFNAVAMSMMQDGVSANDAGTIIGASVAAYCPEHGDEYQTSS